MINLYLTSGSQLAQNDTRFIINQDVALAGDVSIGSGSVDGGANDTGTHERHRAGLLLFRHRLE